MKVLTLPKKLNNIKSDGVIVGIKGLSVNMPAYFEIKDLKKIKKELFISLNKNMLNSDIPFLEKVLKELQSLNIGGIIFYDVAVVNLCQKLNLNYNLIWGQEHITTNVDTVNFWYEQGVKYAYISNDITLREMLEIKKESKSLLMATVFGYLPMFTSKRHLIKNYLETFNLKTKVNVNYMEKEGKAYPITDDSETVVYTNFVLDGLKETLILNYDYVVLNSFNIENNKFNKVVKLFMELNNANLEESQIKLNRLFDNLGKGFFYEETVYKVK